MMNLRKLRYNISNCEVQDWVQLPTKPEMDLWRKEKEKPHVYKVVTKVIVTPTIKRRVVVSHD